MPDVTKVCNKKLGKDDKVEGGVDIISNLHESVIGHILSRLPTTRDAVRTSVLSKDWKYKWTYVYDVKISGTNVFLWQQEPSFINFVSRVLNLSKNATSFDLNFNKRHDLLPSWISHVLDRRSNVETFRLCISNTSLVLSHKLLSCTKLEILHLNGITLKLPVRGSFPSLRTLCLSSINIVNENSSTDTLILEFPVLKSCALWGCNWINVKLVEFHAPSMTMFRSTTSINHHGVEEYMINIFGETLATFESKIGCLPEGYIIQNSSTVVSATISDNYPPKSIDENRVAKNGLKARSLISSFSNLRELKLSGCMAKAIAESETSVALPLLKTLKRLIIQRHARYQSASSGLFEFLHAAPSLKFLGIQFLGIDEIVVRRHEESITSIPLCITQLEEVMFGYTWKYNANHRFELEKFLLKNGLRLKKCSISCYDLDQQDDIVELLSAFPRGSLPIQFGSLTF